ncbi:hypothetical protein M7I_7890 [Glarea lozoyensis 74030]|uniref:Uncharacterized protein n=1 Tax=Glarea lozoyensis (strain ATCC 74030 / MF5533) TaxID=1104152 RepID=H0EYI8_GLAL7|nr:hypothetical protein M7I_7890 [Glarea lozoyensis 74030]
MVRDLKSKENVPDVLAFKSSKSLKYLLERSNPPSLSRDHLVHQRAVGSDLSEACALCGEDKEPWKYRKNRIHQPFR